MLILVGVFQTIAGLVAIVNDEFFVATDEWLFQFDTTTWGWIHLLLGVVIVLAGAALYSGAVWARTVGVIVAVISAIVIITLDIFVIWALTAHGRDITES